MAAVASHRGQRPTPLPDGVVRVFRDNGRNGLSFLAATLVNVVNDLDDRDLRPHRQARRHEYQPGAGLSRSSS